MWLQKNQVSFKIPAREKFSVLLIVEKQFVGNINQSDYISRNFRKYSEF